MARCLAFLLAVAGFAAVAMPARSDPSDAAKPADKAETKANPRELIIGKWRLVDPEVKQTIEFSGDGVLKVTTGHFVANGKLLPLTKDGKPIEVGLTNGKYKFTSDDTIEGEVDNPFVPSDSKTWKFRVKPASVSKDRLTLPGRRTFVPTIRTADYAGDDSGGVTEYERVK